MSNKKLHILTYDHGGYVLWKDEVKPRLLKMFQWLEKYPKLRIGLDYESFTFDEFSRCDYEVVALIGKLLQKYPGRVGLGATTYGQPLALTINDESNARQLLYAVRTNLEYFNTTPDVYAISEFALHNQTPQLISLCGYKAAILRSHVMGYGYTKTFDSPWGNWIGKDGTTIPAVPTYDTQGRGYNCTTVDNWILSRWPVDSDLYSLEDFEKMYEKYSPLLASRYDDLTQPIEESIKYIETKDNYEYLLLEDIPSVFGKPTDTYDTEDTDFHVQMPWGYCGNEIFNGCRQGEVNAIEAEKLNAFSVLLGDKSYEASTEEAWKYILAAEHHDVTICGLLDLSRRFIPQSLKYSQDVKSSALKYISEKLASPDAKSLLVINHHSFPVDEWIKIPVNDNLTVSDGEAAAECEVFEAQGEKILSVHVKLAPFEFKKLTFKKSELNPKSLYSFNESTNILTTPCYEIKLADNGITYIKDLATDKLLINNACEGLFTGNINGKDEQSQGKWQVFVSSLGANAVYCGTIGSVPFELSMSFAGKEKRIDCKTRCTVNNDLIGRTDITQGRPVPLTLNGHHHEDKLCLNLNLQLSQSRRMFRDLPYSISEWNGAVRKTEKYWYPNDDILIDTVVSAEESFNSTTYYHGIYWLSVKDKENGIAIFNKGCMGCALTGNNLRIPLIYSNEYMCGTRILDGVFENEFAIFPFDSQTNNISIHKKALSYAIPPIKNIVEKGNGTLTDFKPFNIETNNEEIILTTAYPEDDYILARFCNYSDSESVAVFASSLGNIECETDLLGNKTNEIINNTLNFHPWEIKTVKISKK